MQINVPFKEDENHQYRKILAGKACENGKTFGVIGQNDNYAGASAHDHEQKAEAMQTFLMQMDVSCGNFFHEDN